MTKEWVCAKMWNRDSLVNFPLFNISLFCPTCGNGMVRFSDVDSMHRYGCYRCETMYEIVIDVKMAEVLGDYSAEVINRPINK